MTNPKQIIIDMIKLTDDIVLSVGENEFYVENKEFSLSINYSLEKKDFSLCEDEYDFNIESIFLINNTTNEEIEYDTDDDISSLLFGMCTIKDWSGNDIDLDSYIEDNF